MNNVGNILRVIWNDAWWDQDTISEEEFEDSCETTTFGLCVRDGLDIISLAHEMMIQDDEALYTGVTHIHKSLVISMDVYNT